MKAVLHQDFVGQAVDKAHSWLARPGEIWKASLQGSKEGNEK